MPHTLFISDLHLEPGRQDICQAFIRLAQSELARSADSLYILGDFVEYWIGDDTPTTGIEDTLAALKALSDSGVPIYFQHGNRDFLIGTEFAERYGIQLLPQSITVDLYGNPTLLLHGDTLCTDDIDYQNFRKMVRDLAWQEQFLSQSLQERIETVKKIRSATKEAVQQKEQSIMDVNQDTVLKTFSDYGVRYIIHGHTHRPAQHVIDQEQGTLHRTVLSDWDKQGNFLLVKPDEQKLCYFAFDAKEISS